MTVSLGGASVGCGLSRSPAASWWPPVCPFQVRQPRALRGAVPQWPMKSCPFSVGRAIVLGSCHPPSQPYGYDIFTQVTGLIPGRRCVVSSSSSPIYLSFSFFFFFGGEGEVKMSENVLFPWNLGDSVLFGFAKFQYLGPYPTAGKRS